MNKNDWIRKLTSRKLWVALAGLAAGVVIWLRGDGGTAETVSGVIMSLGSVVAYVLGEGMTDAAAAACPAGEKGE